MAEKRRASARLKEPAAKRRASGPTVVETPQPTPAPKKVVKEKTPPPEIEPLPTKLVDGKPLPTVMEPQGTDLSDSEWQSINESGVLAASLARSRQCWLHEGIFEKYWSKSTYKSKKKDTTDGEKTQGKQPKPAMTKVGTCKMNVEPHIFDVTIYIVKGTAQPQPLQQQQQQPLQPQQSSTTTTPMQGERQFVQYGPATPAPGQTPPYQTPRYQAPLPPAKTQNPFPSPASVSATPIQHSNVPPASGQTSTPKSTLPINTKAPSPANTVTSAPTTVSTSIPQPQPPSKTTPAPAPPRPQPNPSTTLPTTLQQSTYKSSPAHTPAKSTPAKPAASTPASNGKTPGTGKATGTAAPQVATDPVIHMLAQRASTDYALKQVMKIVASGQANAAQLEYFQKHIDELTKIVKDRQAEEERKKGNSTLPKSVSQVSRPMQSTPGPYQGNTAKSTSNQQLGNGRPGGLVVPQPYPGTPAGQHHNRYYPPPPVRARPVVVPPPPLHVLLEFAQNSTDRFLFPRNSILEYSAGGMSLLASFLVVKKVDENGRPETTESKKESKKKAENGTDETNVEKPKSQLKEQFQPVTVRFDCPSDSNVLQVLGRVVAPVEEVQKYMIAVAQRCTRVATVELAMRLPRESKDASMLMSTTGAIAT